MVSSMQSVVEFVRRHWKPLAVALALILAFAFGRYGTPERIVYKTQEKIVEVEKVVEVEVEKVVEKKIYVDNTKVRVKREETVTKAPDGTETKTTKEDIKVDTDVTEKDEVVKEKIVYVDREVKVEVEKKVYVDKSKPLPDWRIGLLGGINGPAILGIKDGIQPEQFAVGAEVHRRVLGPVSLGGWAISTGQAGVSVSLEF